MRSRGAAVAGSALWFLIAPGALAGLVPWALTGWRFGQGFGSGPALAGFGTLLILLGFAVLVESFGEFALRGIATPAPITPTSRLIVTGAYRHVRNPMYLAVLGVIVGQALLFSQPELLAFAMAILLIFHFFVVLYEEPTMRRRFAEEYAAYEREVGRWLPRFRPWRGAA